MRLDPSAHGARTRAAGFTLIELIVVMLLIGMLGATVGIFIRNPVNSYFSTINRAALTDAADLVVRRMARELQAAVPNSVRVTSSGTTQFLEFVPVVDTGRYRVAASNGNDPTGIYPLNFSNPGNNYFQILGPTVNAPAGSQLVIMNLGFGNMNLYTGGNVRALSVTGNNLQTISYTPAGLWPAASPANRFYLFTTAVTYVCSPNASGTGTLTRYYGYTPTATQPNSVSSAPLSTASSALVINDVSTCSFTPGTAQTDLNSMQIDLQLSNNGESVTLYSQVITPNGP